MNLKATLCVLMLGGLLLTACNNNKPSNLTTEASTNANRTADNHTSLADAKVKFEFEENTQSDPPTAKIFININGKRTEIASATGVVNEMGISERTANNVPEDAVAACQSFWAGGGEVYFAENTGDAIIIKMFYIDEQVVPDATPQAKEIKRITAQNLM